MTPLRPFHVPTFFAILAIGGAALALTGCAAGDNQPAASKSLSGLRDKSQSMMRLGDASRQAGDCPAAVRFYRMVKETGDNHSEAAAARIGAGDCELTMNALPDAERDYKSAMALSPRDAGPLIGLGRIALVQHKPDEAASLLDRALKTGGDAPYVWNDKGVAYDQLRRHKEAQEAYRAGLAKYGTDRALRNNLALSLAMSGQFPEAESLLRSLAAEPDATPRTRQNLALVLGLEGKTAEARQIAQADLDGAALDNNGHFYRYARALLTGDPLPSAVAALDTGEAAPARPVHAEAIPVPPPVLIQEPKLTALRPAAPGKIEESASLSPADVTGAVAAPPTQTAALPATPDASPAPEAKSPPARSPKRIVASDGGPLDSEAAKPAGPVASSE